MLVGPFSRIAELERTVDRLTVENERIKRECAAKLTVYTLQDILAISLNEARILQALRGEHPVSRERLLVIGEVGGKGDGLGVRLHRIRDALRDVT